MQSYMSNSTFQQYLRRGFTPVRINPLKIPTDKEWQKKESNDIPYTEGQLYGFMPPHNCVIADVDVKGSKSGLESFRSFVMDNPSLPQELAESPEEHYNVRTPSGGFHFYLELINIDYKEIPKTHRKYPGIDFITHGKSQAVAGSQSLSNGHYELKKLGIISALTTLTCFQDTPTIHRPKNHLPANVYSGISKEFTVDQFTKILSYLTDDSYEVWTQVARVLMKTNLSPEEQYEVFSSWSSLSPKYNEQTCKNKWEILKKDYSKERSPGIGTLIYLTKNCIRNNKSTTAEEDLRTLYSIIYGDTLDGLRGKIIRLQSRSTTTQYYDIERDCWLDKGGVRLELNPLINYLSEQLKRKIKLDDLELMGYIPIPCDEKYSPHMPSPLYEDEKGALYRNIYNHALLPKPIPYTTSEYVDFYLHHLTQIFGSKYVNDFLSFIAYIVQNPGERLRYMIVLQGGQGIGKGLCLEVIKNHVIGHKNMNLVTSTQLLSGRTGWAFNYQLIHIDEFKISGSQSELALEALKTLITDKESQRVEKYLVDNKLPCYASFIALTNHVDCLKDADHRRYHGIISPIRTPEDLDLGHFSTVAEYFDFLGELADPNNPRGGEILHYFLNYNIPSSFNPNIRPKISDYDLMRVASNATNEDENMLDLIQHICDIKTPDYINIVELIERCMDPIEYDLPSDPTIDPQLQHLAQKTKTEERYFNERLTRKQIKKFAKRMNYEIHASWLYKATIKTQEAKTNILHFAHLEQKKRATTKNLACIFSTKDALELLKNK